MGALPMADVTIYYLHIRGFGKGYNEFYQQAKNMGVEFVKGKVARIKETENKDLILKYEDIATGQVKEAHHDMVVLSVGVLPEMEIIKVFNGHNLETALIFRAVFQNWRA